MVTPDPPSEASTLVRSIPADVLVLEDNMIIALDAEDMLRDLGVRTVRLAGSVQQAIDHIAAYPPQFALLDVNLGLETSFGIAERLRDLGVPIAFATGYGDEHAFPAEFADAPVVHKPYSGQTIQDVLFKAT